MTAGWCLGCIDTVALGFGAKAGHGYYGLCDHCERNNNHWPGSTINEIEESGVAPCRVCGSSGAKWRHGEGDGRGRLFRLQVKLPRGWYHQACYEPLRRRAASVERRLIELNDLRNYIESTRKELACLK